MTLILNRISMIFLLICVLILFSSSVVFSDAKVQIISQNAISEFPSGIRFSIEAESDVPIEQIALRMKFGQQKSGVYE